MAAGPGVWRASDWPQTLATWPSGHSSLDAVLPGHGWPTGRLVDVLQPEGLHLEWRLLLPALAAWLQRDDPASAHRRRHVLLVQPPHVPGLKALRLAGLASDAVVLVQAAAPAERLWALEQALACPDVAAVLAWLPDVPMRALRRLSQAAQRHGGLCWLFRPQAVHGQPTAAVLQLALGLAPPQPLSGPVGNPAGVLVRVLKRQGPPLLQPVVLQSDPDRLSAVLAGARWRQALRRQGPPPTESGRMHAPLLAVPAVLH